MGYIWKLTELEEIGLVIKNACLIQVGVDVIGDRGIWLSLNNGEIYLIKNSRRFEDLKDLKEDDSFFQTLTTDALYIYPGENPARARWENAEYRKITPQDLETARKTGKTDFADIIKSVKSQIKTPIADKNPIFPLQVAKFGVMKTEGKDVICVFDEKDAKIPLRLDVFGFILTHISREQAEPSAEADGRGSPPDKSTLICRFDQDMKTDILWGVPVALITQEDVIRFTY
jgi:hypothetical protein